MKRIIPITMEHISRHIGSNFKKLTSKKSIKLTTNANIRERIIPRDFLLT